jgi:hypothetical protein
VVGNAGTKPCGDRVYFLSRYLLRKTKTGYEILEVEQEPGGSGMMRSVRDVRVLASDHEVFVYPEKVNLHDRANLVKIASAAGKQCTVFTGHDEHMNFVFDPDMSAFLTIHVYDIIPPRPSLSSCIRELESTGLFGELSVVFEHHLRDISRFPVDVHPCRAAGFGKTLDRDPLAGGERIAGCMTGRQLHHECTGSDGMFEETCPLSFVDAEPFIARCCRSEREGTGTWQGKSGAVVHWGASPIQILDAVHAIAGEWRERHADSSR